MTSLWQDIEPYVQVLMKNPDFDTLQGDRERSGEIASGVFDAPARGKHARKTSYDSGSALTVRTAAAEQIDLDSTYAVEAAAAGDGMPVAGERSADGRNLANSSSEGTPIYRNPMESLTRSHARQERIDELKLRYIAGKAAGRDVVDRKGNVIIKRGDILNADNILLAEQAGKLVELIVHMVIDDVGE